MTDSMKRLWLLWSDFSCPREGDTQKFWGTWRVWYSILWAYCVYFVLPVMALISALMALFKWRLEELWWWL